jgi:hypothetical protein
MAGGHMNPECARDIESIIARIKKRIQEQDPTIVQIFIEPAELGEEGERSEKAA